MDNARCIDAVRVVLGDVAAGWVTAHVADAAALETAAGLVNWAIIPSVVEDPVVREQRDRLILVRNLISWMGNTTDACPGMADAHVAATALLA